MKIRKIVLGAGYGDEGKGITTARLVSEGEKTLVTRFNGGPNAGHTVVLEDGSKHVFSQFGSGTLQGAATRISKYMYLEPMALLQELDALLKIKPDLWLQLYIDPETELITPYDIIKSRENNKKETTGMGMIETYNRIQKKFSLKFSDLSYKWVLEEKLKNISSYYLSNFGKINNEVLEEYIQACRTLIEKTSPWHPIFEENYKEHIYEGSQGILLDPDIGFFPFCTPSTCTSQNALELMGDKEHEIHFVTRAYHTRHGNGPFKNKTPLVLKDTEDETNVNNEFQGEFKKSVLDLSLLQYAINSNPVIYKKNFLHITCLDQIVGVWQYIVNDVLYSKDPEKFKFDNLIIKTHYKNKI
jgi:adenylosuccinate synthase